MNRITIQELSHAKFSDLLQQVIEDVIVMKTKYGIEVDMSNYIFSNGHCSACIGGASVLGFLGDPSKFEETIKKAYKKAEESETETDLDCLVKEVAGDSEEEMYNLNSIAHLFNCLRLKDSYGAMHRLRIFSNLPAIKRGFINNTLAEWFDEYPIKFRDTDFEMERLISELSALLKNLRERGL